MNNMNGGLPKVRGAVEALTSALKTGSIIFIVIRILELAIQICFAIIEIPLRILFGNSINKFNSKWNHLINTPIKVLLGNPDNTKSVKPTSTGTVARFLKEDLPKMSAGEQLRYKQTIKEIQQHYIDSMNKHGIK